MENYGLLLKELLGPSGEAAPISITVNLLLKEAKEPPVWIGDFDGAEGILYNPANAPMGLGHLPVSIVRQSQTTVALVGHAPQKKEFSSTLYTITSEEPLAPGNELLFTGATLGSASLRLRFVVRQFQADKK